MPNFPNSKPQLVPHSPNAHPYAQDYLNSICATLRELSPPALQSCDTYEILSSVVINSEEAIDEGPCAVAGAGAGPGLAGAGLAVLCGLAGASLAWLFWLAGALLAWFDLLAGALLLTSLIALAPCVPSLLLLSPTSRALNDEGRP